MRYFRTTGVALAIGFIASPAHAFEFKQMLTQVFGSSDPRDLGAPIFALIVVSAVLFFWVALKIGRKRQRRMIENYDAQLQDYASRLRRGKL